MGPLQKLELQLDDLLRKKVPFQLPESSRKSLAQAMWWLALIFGLLQLWFAYAFWRLAERVDELVDFANRINIYGTIEPVQQLGLSFYLALTVIIVDAAIMLAAVPKLKEFKKQGWDLLFIAALVNLAAGVLLMFTEYGGGFGDFLRALIFSAIGGYFLFQVREYFKGIKNSSAPVAVEKTQEKTV